MRRPSTKPGADWPLDCFTPGGRSAPRRPGPLGKTGRRRLSLRLVSMLWLPCRAPSPEGWPRPDVLLRSPGRRPAPSVAIGPPTQASGYPCCIVLAKTKRPPRRGYMVSMSWCGLLADGSAGVVTCRAPRLVGLLRLGPLVRCPPFIAMGSVMRKRSGGFLAISTCPPHGRRRTASPHKRTLAACKRQSRQHLLLRLPHPLAQ